MKEEHNFSKMDTWLVYIEKEDEEKEVYGVYDCYILAAQKAHELNVEFSDIGIIVSLQGFIMNQ